MRRRSLIALAARSPTRCLAAAAALAGATPPTARRLYRAARTAIRSTRTTSARAIAASSAARRARCPTTIIPTRCKHSGIVWDEETLDKWLTDPQAFVPGAKMFYHLDNPQDRADVIAFLKERAK